MSSRSVEGPSDKHPDGTIVKVARAASKTESTTRAVGPQSRTDAKSALDLPNGRMDARLPPSHRSACPRASGLQRLAPLVDRRRPGVPQAEVGVELVVAHAAHHADFGPARGSKKLSCGDAAPVRRWVPQWFPAIRARSVRAQPDWQHGAQEPRTMAGDCTRMRHLAREAVLHRTAKCVCHPPIPFARQEGK